MRRCSFTAVMATSRTTPSSATFGTCGCTRSWKAPTRSCASSSPASSSAGGERSKGSGMSADILFDRKDGLAVVTLNRPDALNALTLDMARPLDRLLVDVATDDGRKAATRKTDRWGKSVAVRGE